MSADDTSQPKVNESLIDRALAQDEQAYEEIIEIIYPLLIGIIRRNLAQSESPEDLAQEILVKIFSGLPNYRRKQPFEHWISRIATLTCYDALRKRYRRPKLQYTDLSSEQCEALSVANNQENSHPDTQFASRELLDQLLATLKPRDELVIRLLHLEEKTVSEISEETGWSRSKIKVTAMRARNKLKEALERLEATKPKNHHES